MTVKKLFWKKPYLTKIKARILSLDGPNLTLDQTIAYALSGGQASDSRRTGGDEILQLSLSWNGFIKSIIGRRKSAQILVKRKQENEKNEIRYWEIAGFARVPCGGIPSKENW